MKFMAVKKAESRLNNSSVHFLPSKIKYLVFIINTTNEKIAQVTKPFIYFVLNTI